VRLIPLINVRTLIIISGRKGEKIINVRTLISGISRTERTIETVGGSGQYL